MKGIATETIQRGWQIGWHIIIEHIRGDVSRTLWIRVRDPIRVQSIAPTLDQTRLQLKREGI